MYNKVFLIGNLVRDPELRYTSSGIPVAHFSIAVNRIAKKGSGGEENNAGQDVDFINIVAWRRLAEICGEYLKKGRPVALEGRLQIRSYTGRDGQKRTMAEVIADNMQMLGKRGDFAGSGAAENRESEIPADHEAEPAEEAPF